MVRFDSSVVLPGVSLSVDKGDFLAITGPNGGGKTTLLRVMLKLLRPDSGRVEYLSGGKTVSRLPIGYLPQKSMIDTRFPITVGEIVKSGAMKGLLGRFPSGTDNRFQEIVERMGVGDILDRPVGALSGGQLQRTLLGRALMTDPEVLMLDEPLSYVDKDFEREIYSMMDELRRTHTIVLVSHEMSVISRMANRHLTVDRGLRESSPA